MKGRIDDNINIENKFFIEEGTMEIPKDIWEYIKNIEATKKDLILVEFWKEYERQLGAVGATRKLIGFEKNIRIKKK